MRLIRFLLALGLAGLVVAGVYLLGDERRATGGDGAGYRLALESPSTMQPGVCPDYRDNAGATYFWDRHAFTEVLEAQLSRCGRIDTGPLGEWVVEERSDSQGNYSISAHLDARSHTVTFDWGEFVPSLSLNCWRGDNEEERQEDEDRNRTAGSFLDVWLWHFGPPQLFYGEPTPVRYRFAEESSSDVALWWGHSAQAEVVVLPDPALGLPEHADSHTFAAQMRNVAAANGDSESGPILTAETWEGESTSPLGVSQGTITFDLAGLERAAFPVFDACGV